ncbi:MAG: BON domain-containing protein [Cyanobacteria bacterium J06638_28]
MGVYHSHEFAFARAVQQSSVVSAFENGCTSPSWFRTIPPERIGIDGGYDYYGLQKRVQAAFKKRFSTEELAGLGVSQRGRVVVLYGHVPSRDVLNHLVLVAQRVEGATRVESACTIASSKASLMVTG